mmetsp:Transcript_21427/g.47784  ORF Transcript_21427/g.47784 Transcript_21427/m.47784 type:complete len:221 (+) Transcript_21427:461-1123(+)
MPPLICGLSNTGRTSGPMRRSATDVVMPRPASPSPARRRRTTRRRRSLLRTMIPLPAIPQLIVLLVTAHPLRERPSPVTDLPLSTCALLCMIRKVTDGGWITIMVLAGIWPMTPELNCSTRVPSAREREVTATCALVTGLTLSDSPAKPTTNGLPGTSVTSAEDTPTSLLSTFTRASATPIVWSLLKLPATEPLPRWSPSMVLLPSEVSTLRSSRNKMPL